MRHRLIFLPLLWAAVSLTAQTTSAQDVEITAEPHHHLALENEFVRVFKVDVPPHADTLMHWHRHDYVFVTLGASEVSNDVQGKPPVTLKLQDGETRFISGNFAHIARSLSDQPFRNVTIELLQDEKNRSRSESKSDRGVTILQGGTRDVLFVKDGVKTTDVQLNPGAIIPRHHHAYPHLVVAVTDLELKGDNADGTASSMMKLSAGDIQWVPAGATHTVTNVAKHPAHYIALEFQ